ncbi:MAG: hypothetical protein U0797_12865 [Gemmataceae bacterium]
MSNYEPTTNNDRPDVAQLVIMLARFYRVELRLDDAGELAYSPAPLGAEHVVGVIEAHRPALTRLLRPEPDDRFVRLALEGRVRELEEQLTHFVLAPAPRPSLVPGTN